MMENKETQWKGTWREDWRITGQESYLKGKHLHHMRFSRSFCTEDYDQCEFCWRVFDKDIVNPEMAYFDGKHWICEECYKDFKDYFQWTVEEKEYDMPGDCARK